MSSEAASSVTSMREARRSRARRARAVESGPPLSTFIASWQLALEAASKSPRTVRSYLDSVRALYRFLGDQDMPASVEDVDSSHIRAFLLAEEQQTSAASAAVHFRNIRVFTDHHRSRRGPGDCGLRHTACGSNGTRIRTHKGLLLMGAGLDTQTPARSPPPPPKAPGAQVTASSRRPQPLNRWCWVIGPWADLRVTGRNWSGG